MEWIAVIGPVTALLSLLGVIFNFSVLRPLNLSIRALNLTIDELRVQIRELEEKRQMTNERLVKVESSAKSAHHRIDYIEAEMRIRNDRQS